MKIQTETFIKAMSYFDDQLYWAKQKEDNDTIISYYKDQINSLTNRYYSQ